MTQENLPGIWYVIRSEYFYSFLNPNSNCSVDKCKTKLVLNGNNGKPWGNNCNFVKNIGSFTIITRKMLNGRKKPS